MEQNQVIVYADKTVIKISGMDIHGMDTQEVERLLMERFRTVVRVIGVTGSSIDMDVYGIDPEQILRDEQGVIQTIAAAEGVTPLEVARLAAADRITEADFDHIPEWENGCCAGERWRRHD